MDDRIRGVNLGNWLVLERWMDEGPFAGTRAEDEERLREVLDADALKLRLEQHRSRYISENDFAHIAALGLNAVRVPVPHFVLGKPGYEGCARHLDQAFVWAERHGLRVLVDIHTAPGSQNGFDNGGLSGPVGWHLSPQSVDETVELAGALAERYAARPALWGIELLNEPVSWLHRRLTARRYASEGRVQPSRPDWVPLRVLRDYYQRGYDAVRAHSARARVVLHDGFRPFAWRGFLGGAPDVVFDTHLYVGLAPLPGFLRREATYAQLARWAKGLIGRLGKDHEVIVGEWSLAMRTPELARTDEAERARLYRAFANAQLASWNRCAGWFFWSWKCDARPDWSLQEAAELGWLEP